MNRALTLLALAAAALGAEAGPLQYRVVFPLPAWKDRDAVITLYGNRGYCVLGDRRSNRIFLVHRGKIVDRFILPNGLNPQLSILSMNDYGEAVGVAVTGRNLPCYWRAAGAAVFLPLPAGRLDGWASDIDNSRIIVGASADKRPNWGPTLWDSNFNAHVLPSPVEDFCHAKARDPEGRIVLGRQGGSYRYDPGEGFVEILPPPGASNAGAKDISKSGLVVGSSFYVPALIAKPFIFTLDNRYIEIEPREDGEFGDVNALDHATGLSGTVQYKDWPNFWSEDTGWLILAEHMEPGSRQYTLSGDAKVNDKGQVSCWVKLDGEFRPGIAEPVTTDAPATSFRLETGRLEAGGLGSLAARDGDALRAARFIVPNRKAPPVSLVVEAALPERALYLWLRTSLRSANAGVRATAELYDWQAAGYDDAWTEALTAEYQPLEAIGTLKLDRYRGPEGKVRARITCQAPENPGPWSVEFDEAVLEWVPVPPKG
ncbi:MAG: hypothetical protein KIT11_07180 [Fimbriimonadaceae bacterium]|nr:hypothetical protein [Fimbriimonadaceae bacterium]QYK56134.1 MAG: hypothetical protein KF733_01370 [Fimbriimonadaceae bacterium]